MKNKVCYNLLISSPMDVQAERDTVEEACNDYNTTFGDEKNVRIEVKRWEKDLNIDSRVKSQQLINDQLVNNCDILFAIFGKRFGTPTEKFESGTLEEIEQILAKGIPIFVYFMNNRYSIHELDPVQINRVQSFRQRLAESGSFKDIEDKNVLKKEFTKDLNFHVNELLKSVQILPPAAFSSSIAESDNLQKENWYELSISELINNFLQENDQPLAVYKRGITFIENKSLWKSVSDITYPALMDVANAARQYAFNIKYGNYDYAKDLRSIYPNWYNTILQLLKEKNLTNNISVIGIAGNYGMELNEIFDREMFKEASLDVLELSPDAIKRGRAMFKNIKFFSGNMEDNNALKNSHYDVYLNLRSIHSSGVDFQMALSECHRILKPNGIAIISVSNGYLTPKKPGAKELFEVKGLYDNRTETFSKHRPNELARKIHSKLLDYGFQNVNINSGPTEIFISGIK